MILQNRKTLKKRKEGEEEATSWLVVIVTTSMESYNFRSEEITLLG